MKEFTDWAFTFMTSFLYYLDYDTIDEQTRDLYHQGISALGGISPPYWIALEKNSPVIVGDFHSLLVMVQMCFSFILTDKDSDMRMCKHCKKAFVASRKGNEFCSQKCKNQFNIYKSRETKKEDKKDALEQKDRITTLKKCLQHCEDCDIFNIKKDTCANRCPTEATDRRLAQLIKC